MGVVKRLGDDEKIDISTESEITPSSLGITNLPSKFTKFRPGQGEAVLSILSSPERFKLFGAPTGAGKSLIYVSTALALNLRALIVVSSKGLQDQLLEDFGESGLVDVRGRNNYSCHMLSEVRKGITPVGGGRPNNTNRKDCEVGSSNKCLHRVRRDESLWDVDNPCPYDVAVSKAKESNLVVTNYHYWMSICKYNPNALGDFDLLIFDEAHSAPDILSDFCAIELLASTVRSIIHCKIPDYENDLTAWSEWAVGARAKAADVYKQVRDSEGGDSKNLLKIKSLGLQLAELANVARWDKDTNHASWIHEEIKGGKGHTFTPVWPYKYAERYMYSEVENIIHTSATLTPRTARYLGVEKESSKWVGMGSGFDPKRRPFIFVSSAPRIDYQTGPTGKSYWVELIDKTIDPRDHLKGIIHTRSYNRAREIYNRSRHKTRMIIHESGKAMDAVEEFISADPGAILVSPSVEEGFDFPGDLCRWQVIAKIPFVHTATPLMRARKNEDPDYPNYLTSQALVQSYGRGMRSSNDWCETFLIDGHWKWFKSKGDFPRWFKASWQEKVIPSKHDLEALGVEE